MWTWQLATERPRRSEVVVENGTTFGVADPVGAEKQLDASSAR
jgi:hypothetical protein